MSAVEALRRKRDFAPKKDESEGADDPAGGARTLKLTEEESKGLPPGEEVSLTVTGRLGPDGKLDVISVAAGDPGPTEQPPMAPPMMGPRPPM